MGHARQPRTDRPERAALVGLAALVLGVVPAAAAGSGEEAGPGVVWWQAEAATRAAVPRPLVLAPAPLGGGPFPLARTPEGLAYRRELMHRVSFEMHALSALQAAAPPNWQLADLPLFEEMSRRVQRGAERATRDIVGDYLLEVTDLDRRIEGIKVRRSRGGGASTGSAEGLRVSVGFYRTLPRVELRQAVSDHGTLRVGLGVAGAVNVEYRDDRYELARIALGFDGDDRFFLGARLGF